MATALTDLVLNVGSITGLGQGSVNNDDTTPTARPGTIRFFVDAFGVRIIKYCKFLTAQSMGDLASKVANTAVNNILSGTTTSATTTGLTASAHDGKIAYVLDNDDSAGAAPEGEMALVGSNSTTVISLDRSRPLSVALAVNDDLVLISNWQSTDAADGDLAINVQGVVLGNAGITIDRYGWVQTEGFVQANLKASTALTAGDPVVADTAKVGSFGSDGQELWIGYALAAVSSDIVSDIAPVNLRLFTAAGPGTSP